MSVLIIIKREFPAFLFFILIAHSTNVALAKEAPEQVKGVKTIDLIQAKNLYLSGAVFIDVRESGVWSVGHIQGSVHLDFTADEFVVLYVSEALEKDTPVVFYCESPLESSGALASFFAAAWGYENVHFFRDGYYAWLAADYPIGSKLGLAHSGISDEESFMSADVSE